MYYESIDNLIKEYNEQLELKADSRKEFKKCLVILRTLASEYSPLKSSASIDNKINSLLSFTEDSVRSQALDYFARMEECEVIYKNARDRIDYLKLCIIELQSRRRCERELK